MIDLTNIEPNLPSKNLKNYIGLIYGDPGSGKTSTLAQIPRSLLIGCEVGWKAIPGIHAVPALDYTSVLTVINQLKKSEVKEKYDVVVIDTVDALYYITEKYILNKHGVSRLNDLEWGLGHIEIEALWKNIIKSIIKEGYGLMLIGHRAVRRDPEDEDEEATYSTLALSNKRVRQYLISEVDYMAYVEASRDPNKRSILHFKASPNWDAKARFPNIVPHIELSYDNIVTAIHNAIDSVTDNATEERIVFSEQEDQVMEEKAFNELHEETEKLAKEIIAENENNLGTVVRTIEHYLGKKLAKATPSDGERVKLLKEALKTL